MYRKVLPFTVAIVALLSFTFVLAGETPQTQSAATPGISLTMPGGAYLTTFEATADGKTLFISGSAMARSPGEHGETAFRSVNLATGAVTDLNDLIKSLPKENAFTNCEVSPDGKYAVAIASTYQPGPPPKMESKALLLNLKARTSAQADLQDAGMGYWIDGKFYSARMADQSLQKACVLDPATGKKTELPFCAVVFGKAANGNLIVGAGADLTKPAPTKDLESSGRIVLVDLKGKIQGSVCGTSIIGSKPAVSTGGKLLGFQMRRPGGTSMPATRDVTATYKFFTTDGKKTYELKAPAGNLLMLADSGDMLISVGYEATVYFVSAKGESRRLAGSVSHATAAGGKLIYVPVPQVKDPVKPVVYTIKSIDLPKELTAKK